MDAAVIWLKVLHISALAVWCAGLFYLPGLFAAHHRRKGNEFRRLRRMTHLAFLGIATPAGILAVLSGAALIAVAEAMGGWLALKLTAVAVLMGFHLLCGWMVDELGEGPARWSPAAQLSLLAVPGVTIPVILYLVLAKPV